jgi:hypothetical protein
MVRYCPQCGDDRFDGHQCDLCDYPDYGDDNSRYEYNLYNEDEGDR